MGTLRNLYPDDRIADIVERKRIELGITVEAAAERAGMGSASSWYKKAEKVTPFKVEEIGRFSASIDAPPGWPFVEWAAAAWLRERLAR